MKKCSVFAVVSILALATANAGDITGKVTLNGTPPAEKQITPLKDDATCGKLHSEMPTTHFFVVGPNKELADVVVMLKGDALKASGASAKPVELDQKGCEYTPQILAIQTGQKLLVKNSDPVLHNIHINPAADGNKGKNPENLPQMMKGPDLTFSFPAPENFMKFQCDVHPWMFAWLTVVDNPYFAITDKNGAFKISNVPPGKYKIVALHRKAAPTGIEKEIEVKDGGATQDFTLELK